MVRSFCLAILPDEHLLEAVQQRLDANPQAMRQRRETVEHPFGTIKARMGATHFLTKTLPKVAAEMALSVLAYDLTRVMNIVGSKQLMTAIGASDRAQSLASRPTSIEAVFTRPRPLADLLQKVPNTFEPSYRIEGREQRSLIGDRELDVRCNHVGEPARIADPLERRLELWHTTLLY